MSIRHAGIGLRAPHYAEVIAREPALGFLEVHSENFFHAGGAALNVLKRVRERYPVSLHGVGLSLASTDELAARHLDSLATLIERVEPALVSEHLCWCGTGGTSFNDLLPFPYTREALDWVCARVDQVQSRLRRPVLIENISAYVRFHASEMSECDFLAELVARTGCGLLFDVNNLYVNARNFGFDAVREMHKLPAHAVGEIHLAGHMQTEYCLIDTHGSRVCEEVWSLYGEALRHVGTVPTLIEWDTDLPSLDVLLDEAAHANGIACAEAAAYV